MSGVVGVAGEDGGGAVDLLGENDAGELVGEGDASEGEEELRLLAGGGGPAVGGTDGEDETLGAVVAETAEAGGELLGGELVATAVEKDAKGADAAGVVFEPMEQGWLGVEELGLAGDVAGGASEVVGEQGVGGGGLGAGGAGEDGGESDLHRLIEAKYCNASD